MIPEKHRTLVDKLYAWRLFETNPMHGDKPYACKCLILVLSSHWFPQDERVTATSIAQVTKAPKP